MQPQLPRLADYQVSALNGFLPTTPPCAQISDPYYAPWESLISNLQLLISTRRLRSVVDNLPVLATERLESVAEWRRAYSILAMVVHAYIWGSSAPAEVSNHHCVITARFEVVANGT